MREGVFRWRPPSSGPGAPTSPGPAFGYPTSTPGGPITVEPRINDRIRVPEVRLVGPNGEQVGIVTVEKALRLAQDADLDLVEVAPQARPPVCKLMDFGKFKYESALKAREARKKATHTVIKEMKLRPKIDPHDYETKKGHVVRFLKDGDKVKITIMFRGREQHRPELGFRLLAKLAEDVNELGWVESAPKQDGRNMIMVLGPHRRKADAKAEREADKEVARARRRADDEVNAQRRRARAEADDGDPDAAPASTDADTDQADQTPVANDADELDANPTDHADPDETAEAPAASNEPDSTDEPDSTEPDSTEPGPATTA